MNLKRENANHGILGDLDNRNDNWEEIEENLTSIISQVNDLEDREKITRYGVRRKLGATTPELERLGDAKGLIANADTSLTSYNVVENDFDDIQEVLEPKEQDDE